MGLKAARLEEEKVKLGAKGTLVSLEGRESQFEVIEYIEGQSYAFATSLPLAKLIVRRSFVDETSSRFVHEVRFEGFLAFLWSSQFGPEFRRLLPPTMERLAVLAEVEKASSDDSNK